MGSSRTLPVAIVTGAAGALGRAVCAALSERCYAVALVDLDAARMGTIAAELNTPEQRAISCIADVTDEVAVAGLVERVERELGPIEVLVNGAGIASTTTINDLTRDEWESVLRINLTSAFVCTRAVIPAMVRRRRGAIVNVASVAGKRGGGLVGRAAYATSKAGMIGFTKAVARELAQHGIRANAVAPGPFEGGMTGALDGGERERICALIPQGRFGSPQEVADAVVFLAGASWITGETINVDGGLLME